MTMSTLNKLFIFAAGACIGSAVTYKIIKTKYEQISNDEIESIREMYREKMNKENDNISEERKDDESIPEEEMSEYDKIVNENGYVNYSIKKDVKKEEKNVDEPYVISPEEFDENEDYNTVSLTYYADGVLTDERDNVIVDVDSIVGEDSLNHFGEYEDDSVFVRNDELQTDYEILLDTRNYGDIYVKY